MLIYARSDGAVGPTNDPEEAELVARRRDGALHTGQCNKLLVTVNTSLEPAHLAVSVRLSPNSQPGRTVQ